MVYFHGILETGWEKEPFSFFSICTSVFFYKRALLLKLKYKPLKYAFLKVFLKISSTSRGRRNKAKSNIYMYKH